MKVVPAPACKTDGDLRHYAGSVFTTAGDVGVVLCSHYHCAQPLEVVEAWVRSYQINHI